MKIEFLESVMVDGLEFMKGNVYDLPSSIARGFLHGGTIAKMVGKQTNEKPVKKRAVKK